MKIPKNVSDRFSAEIPKFKKILKTAKDKDINENNTVTIVVDMLECVFGFDRYNEITKEFNIQGTYCDLAVKLDSKVEYLLEVKAIGLELKANHLRQTVNYAARSGIKYVVLTNSINWEVYYVEVKNVVTHQKLFEFNFLELNLRRKEEKEMLFLLCKRAINKNEIDDFHQYIKSVNPLTISTLLMSEEVVNLVRRLVSKAFKGRRVTNEELLHIIQEEVIKRDLVTSDEAKRMQRKIKNIFNRNKSKEEDENE